MQFNVTIVFYTIRVNFGEDIPVLLFVTITIMAAVGNVIVIKLPVEAAMISIQVFVVI